MADFPKLSTGAVTQYPSSRKMSFATCVTKFVDGGEQRFRELKSPIRRWLIQLEHVSAHEAAEIELFFAAMQGEFASFAFTDPWDETEYPDCSFDQDRIAVVSFSDVHNQSYLVIRNNTL